MPAPRIDATCDDLLSSPALQGFVGEGPSTLVAFDPSTTTAPDVLALQQLGGVDCMWTTAPAPVLPYQVPPRSEQSVRLRILPEGQEASQEYVAYATTDAAPSEYGPGVYGPDCVGADEYSDGYAACSMAGWIGNVWVDLGVMGIVVQEGERDADLIERFRTVTDPLAATLEATDIVEDRWQAPTPSPSAGRDCDELAPTEAITAATGISGLDVGFRWDGPRAGQYLYALEQTGALRCSLAFAGSDSALGTVSMLPSGRWAFEASLPEWMAAGAQPVELAGLPPGSAVRRCEDPADWCRIDVIVGGDWMQVSVIPSPPYTLDAPIDPASFEAARASVDAIAELVAERMAAHA